MKVQALHRLRRGNSWRTALTVFLLLAVGVQNYIAQTHIHWRGEAGAARAHFVQAIGLHRAGGLEHLGAPAQGSANPAQHAPRDAADGCLLCQIVLHGSAPLLQSVATVLAPAVDVLLLSATFSLIAPLAVVSHNWQSRGPPSN